jgi:serine/threonine-protein kinase
MKKVPKLSKTFGSRRMKVTLTVIAGPHQGREFSFQEHDNFIVGRAKKAQFRLPKDDPYFSRNHFLIEVNPPLCRLLDMGSRNGTFVNGEKVASIELKDGDEIRGGRTVLRVALIDDSVSARSRDSGFRQSESPVKQPSSQAGSASESNVKTLTQTPDLPVSSGERSAGRVAAGRLLQGADAAPFAETGSSPVTLSANEVLSDLIVLDAASEKLLPPNYRELIQQRPQPIEGYQIVDELGRGGMGVVYRAIRTANRSVVAIKTVLPAVRGNRKDYEKFLREAYILKQLNHPRIVHFQEVGESGDVVYFSMEFVPGIDGGKLIRTLDGPMPIARAVRIVCQLLEALESAHAKGFVHRDIKPSNLLIRTDGPADMAYLSDFGLARTYQASKLSGLTMTGAVGGTTAFMAPEQITAFRESKPSVDQYAAAATLYFLLTKYFVYDLPKELSKQLLMILQDDPVPITQRRSDLPAALVDAIHRALTREPADRFPDVAEFRKALQPFVRAT